MTAEVLKNTLSGPGKFAGTHSRQKKRIVQGYDLFLFFLLRQILTLTEAEWQEMAASHNILLKQTQTTILMNEQKVNQERSERLPSISIIAADHLDGNPDADIIPGTVETIPLK